MNRYISAARDFRRQLSKQLAALRGGDVDAGVVRHRSELEDLQQVDDAQRGPICPRVVDERELVRHLNGGVEHKAERENIPKPTERPPR